MTFWSECCIIIKRFTKDAVLAQLVEHILGKDEVAGSTPVNSSQGRILWDAPFSFSPQISRAKGLTIPRFCDIILSLSGCGAVGSALPWGGRGRPFKSGHSDQRAVPASVTVPMQLRVGAVIFYPHMSPIAAKQPEGGDKPHSGYI